MGVAGGVKDIEGIRILENTDLKHKKTPYRALRRSTGLKWCPGPDLNRHGAYAPQDFKSCVSTNSTTRAWIVDAP
jgi:hypothetical protein